MKNTSIFLLITFFVLGIRISIFAQEADKSLYYVGKKWTILMTTSSIITLKHNSIIVECYQPWQGDIIPIQQDTIYGNFSKKDTFQTFPQNETIYLVKAKKSLHLTINHTLFGKLNFRMKAQKVIPKRIHTLRNKALIHSDRFALGKEIADSLGIKEHSFLYHYIDVYLFDNKIDKMASHLDSSHFFDFYLGHRQVMKTLIIARVKK